MASASGYRSDDLDLPSGRAAGIAIAVASLLSTAFMAHHPTAHAHGVADMAAALKRISFVNEIVHGAMIALLGVLVYGFTCLASRLRPCVGCARAGLVAYVAGATALAAAATINGFILVEFLSRNDAQTPEQFEGARSILGLCHAANQVCSRMGVMAISVAIVLWSVPLACRSGFSRAAGVLGCIIGPALVLAVLSGHLAMDRHGMMLFILFTTIWSVAVAIDMIRKHI